MLPTGAQQLQMGITFSYYGYIIHICNLFNSISNYFAVLTDDIACICLKAHYNDIHSIHIYFSLLW